MHLLKRLMLLCAAFALISLPTCASAQTPPARPDPDDTNPQKFLGPLFASRPAGLAFRPPIRGTQIKPAAVGFNIVQYVNADEKWALKVSQMVFEQPMPLIVKAEEKARPADSNLGLLQKTADQLALQNPGSRLLRADLINVGTRDAGMIAIRYAIGSQAYLRQAALIQRHDQHYYLFDLTTPSSRTPSDKDDAEDPSEATAVRVFSAILDSVQFLDLKLIQADNDQRLYCARALMVNMSVRMKQILLPEQYFRVLRNGKDVGWSFVAEELGQRLGENGVFVAIQTEGSTRPNTRLSVASEMFCMDNRRTEAWVSINVIEKDGKREQVSEFGQSDRRTTRKLDPRDPADKQVSGQPAMRMIERYMLNVTQTSDAGGAPFVRELSPAYLPQAFAHLLPRLIPLKDPKGYLFPVWVSSERELIFRYLDVDPEQTVTFAGNQIRAIVIKDRLGLDGDSTLHYFTPKGQYLGNENPASQTAFVATDAKTLTQLWPNAKIARPHVLNAPTDRINQ